MSQSHEMRESVQGGDCLSRSGEKAVGWTRGRDLGAGTGWLQVTGAGALGRDKDFPCKMHSNRQRGNLIPGRDSSEEQETPEGPTDGPRLEGWGRRGERQQDLEGGELG